MSESTRNRRLTKPRDYPNTRSHQRRTTIDDLPAETLSLIFEEVIPVEPDLDEIYGYEGNVSRCLRQAVILSSVSIHLRRAAFGTPELWKRLPLNMDEPIDALVPLLQHCTSHAISLHISITRDHWGQSDAQTLSKAKILLSPNTSEKLELLDLYRSDASEHWIPLLTSFPMLKTLIIGEGGIFSDEDVRLDLGALSKLTQIFIEARFMDSAILPPSIQVLHLANVPQNVQVSLLPQCPNLVTYTNLNDMDYVYDNFAYTEPVTLNHLKRLVWLIDSGLKNAAAVRNVRMPVLEYLTLYSFETIPTIPAAVISLCRQVSATLTTFELNVIESYDVCTGPLNQ